MKTIELKKNWMGWYLVASGTTKCKYGYFKTGEEAFAFYKKYFGTRDLIEKLPMVGDLCWFEWYGAATLGVLKEIQGDRLNPSYLDDRGYFHQFCRPVELNELKHCWNKVRLAGDKDDNIARYIDELKQKIRILNEANMRLETENARLLEKE